MIEKKKIGITLMFLIGITYLTSCNKNQFCSCYSSSDTLISYERLEGNFSTASSTCSSMSMDTIDCALTVPN